MTRLRSRRWLVGRTRLFRFIDRIGRWSNIDLFMISILVALVQFGALTSVRPEPGAVAFAAVVVITMLASRSFDARVMWDATGSARVSDADQIATERAVAAATLVFVGMDRAGVAAAHRHRACDPRARRSRTADHDLVHRRGRPAGRRYQDPA